MPDDHFIYSDPDDERSDDERALRDLSEGSRELSDALRRTAGEVYATDAGRGRHRARGRPRRIERVSPEAVRDAPFAELTVLPADQLCRHINSMHGVRTLRDAYFYELAHDRRSSVLDALESRLGRLGHPLGGPQREPLDGHDRLSAQQVRAALDGADAQLAAEVYAWEYYRSARPDVLEAAAARAGLQRCRERVQETAPARALELPEPFAGYDQLAATPSQRPKVRDALRAQPAEVLEATLRYERATKNRAIMLAAIEAALRR